MLTRNPARPPPWLRGFCREGASCCFGWDLREHPNKNAFFSLLARHLPSPLGHPRRLRRRALPPEPRTPYHRSAGSTTTANGLLGSPSIFLLFAGILIVGNVLPVERHIRRSCQEPHCRPKPRAQPAGVPARISYPRPHRHRPHSTSSAVPLAAKATAVPMGGRIAWHFASFLRPLPNSDTRSPSRRPALLRDSRPSSALRSPVLSSPWKSSPSAVLNYEAIIPRLMASLIARDRAWYCPKEPPHAFTASTTSRPPPPRPAGKLPAPLDPERRLRRFGPGLASVLFGRTHSTALRHVSFFDLLAYAPPSPSATLDRHRSSPSSSAAITSASLALP